MALRSASPRAFVHGCDSRAERTVSSYIVRRQQKRDLRGRRKTYTKPRHRSHSCASFDMPVGRNDPCPCGSGKKYKKCHGVSTIAPAGHPDVARANEYKALDSELHPRLLRFAVLHFGKGWLAEAMEHYASARNVSENELPLAIPWAMHFRQNEDGQTLASMWAQSRAGRLSERDRNLINGYASGWLSIWEVTRVEPGVGVALVDQLTREERFVHDVSSSGILEVHHTILAIIVDCEEISFFGGVHPQPLPPRYAFDALRESRKSCHVRTRSVKPETLRDNEIQLDLIEIWTEVVDGMLNSPPPTLTNTDGEPFSFTRDDFEMTAPLDDVVKRLGTVAGAQEPEKAGGETMIVYTKSGNARNPSWDNTILGRVIVARGRVRVETNSLRRADALRAAIEANLGDMIRHRLREETNTAHLLEEMAAGGSTSVGSGREEAQPPEVVAMLRQFREKHMHGWIDESIPALDGLTPREAARIPRALEKLEVLIKELELSESRVPAAEQIDLSWLRIELGLD